MAATVQQTWTDDLERCERQMHEREQYEQLQQQQDGAA